MESWGKTMSKSMVLFGTSTLLRKKNKSSQWQLIQKNLRIISFSIDRIPCIRIKIVNYQKSDCEKLESPDTSTLLKDDTTLTAPAPWSKARLFSLSGSIGGIFSSGIPAANRGFRSFRTCWRHLFRPAVSFWVHFRSIGENASVEGAEAN